MRKNRGKDKIFGITLKNTNFMLLQNNYVKTWTEVKKIYIKMGETSIVIAEENFCD